MDLVMGHSFLFNTSLHAAPLLNRLPRFIKYNPLNTWGEQRELPEFASCSFNELWKKNKVEPDKTNNDE